MNNIFSLDDLEKTLIDINSKLNRPFAKDAHETLIAYEDGQKHLIYYLLERIKAGRDLNNQSRVKV